MNSLKPKQVADRKRYIVASEYPTGLSWLLNILLELSLKVHRSDAEEFWRESHGKFSLQPEHDEVKRWLPCFSQPREFSFPEPLSLQWTHGWPREDVAKEPILFFNRSGFDATYSEYRRNSADLSFLTFLKAPFRTVAGAFPTIVNLYPAETWALYSLVWKRLAPKESQWVRFEELRADPTGGLESILSSLGVQRSRQDMDRALENSSFQKAKAAEAAYLQLHPGQRVLMNRGGKVGEWKQTYGPEEYSCFAGLPALALKEFGYEAEAKLVEPFNQSRVPSEPGFYEWVEGLRAGRTPLNVVEQQLRSVSAATPSAALTLGRQLAAVQWTRDVDDSRNQSPQFKSRLLAEFAELSTWMSLRPLNLVCFAKALQANGYQSQATLVLDAFLDSSKLSFLESYHLGRLHWRLGNYQAAHQCFRHAGHNLEGASGARLYAWNLMDEGSFSGAWNLLSAARTLGWTRLAVRQWLRRHSGS
jgi:hypothetical protein